MSRWRRRRPPRSCRRRACSAPSTRCCSAGPRARTILGPHTPSGHHQRPLPALRDGRGPRGRRPGSWPRGRWRSSRWGGSRRRLAPRSTPMPPTSSASWRITDRSKSPSKSAHLTRVSRVSRGLCWSRWSAWPGPTSGLTNLFVAWTPDSSGLDRGVFETCAAVTGPRRRSASWSACRGDRRRLRERRLAQLDSIARLIAAAKSSAPLRAERIARGKISLPKPRPRAC